MMVVAVVVRLAFQTAEACSAQRTHAPLRAAREHKGHDEDGRAVADHNQGSANQGICPRNAFRLMFFLPGSNQKLGDQAMVGVPCSLLFCGFRGHIESFQQDVLFIECLEAEATSNAFPEVRNNVTCKF